MKIMRQMYQIFFFSWGWENKKEKKIVPIGNLAIKNKKKFKISDKEIYLLYLVYCLSLNFKIYYLI